MAQLKDSGDRRSFVTGAVRDVAEGKGRCDLLPLRAVGAVLDDTLLTMINMYVRDGVVQCLIEAVRAFANRWYADVETAILECSKQYEDGARKYADRNWENGIPVHCFIDSGVRHYLKYLRGDKDEPHDRAFIWNMLGAIWTHENKPELIDLPFAIDNQHNKTVSVVTNVNDDDMGEEDVGESEPVKGKYDGLDTQELLDKLCVVGKNYCNKCPVNYDGVSCVRYAFDNKTEFRKIAIDYLEGLEGKA